MAARAKAAPVAAAAAADTYVYKNTVALTASQLVCACVWLAACVVVAAARMQEAVAGLRARVEKAILATPLGAHFLCVSAAACARRPASARMNTADDY